MEWTVLDCDSSEDFGFLSSDSKMLTSKKSGSTTCSKAPQLGVPQAEEVAKEEQVEEQS